MGKDLGRAGTAQIKSLLVVFLGGLLIGQALCPSSLVAQRGKRERAPKERPAWKDKRLLHENYIYEDNIRTVQFFREGNELSYPYLRLDQGGILKLRFDETDASPQQYYVEIIHCDADWTRSMLVPSEYYNGISNWRITDYRSSQNTRKEYINYSTHIPQEGGSFRHSGNYLVKVFRDNNPRDLIITRRFVVAENAVRIEPELARTTQESARLRMQSVNFKLYPSQIHLRDPHVELNVQLLQNYRWDNRRTNVRHMFQHQDHLEYRFDAANDFDGGNEFRWFDLRDVSRKLNRISQIVYTDSCDRITLMPDKPRLSGAYFTEPDFNGAYFIGTRQFPLAHVESDYLCVDFLLQAPDLRNEGDVYIFGQLTDWQLLPKFRMKWDGNLYYNQLLLKQGIYNYIYVVLPDEKNAAPSETRLEGSHNETENAYSILVYYRQPADRSDRLIGIHHINTRE